MAYNYMALLTMCGACPVCAPTNRSATVSVIDHQYRLWHCVDHMNRRYQHSVKEIEKLRGTAAFEELYKILTRRDGGRDTLPIIRPPTRFPHTCPKCARPAYIGLNQIEHEDSARDKDCR